MGIHVLCSATEIKVPARGKALVPTDLSIAIPEGTYARVGESSLSISRFLFVGFFFFFGCLMK
jgi:dUTP pyrophosphatase